MGSAPGSPIPSGLSPHSRQGLSAAESLIRAWAEVRGKQFTPLSKVPLGGTEAFSTLNRGEREQFLRQGLPVPPGFTTTPAVSAPEGPSTALGSPAIPQSPQEWNTRIQSLSALLNRMQTSPTLQDIDTVREEIRILRSNAPAVVSASRFFGAPFSFSAEELEQKIGVVEQGLDTAMRSLLARPEESVR